MFYILGGYEEKEFLNALGRYLKNCSRTCTIYVQLSQKNVSSGYEKISFER